MVFSNDLACGRPARWFRVEDSMFPFERSFRSILLLTPIAVVIAWLTVEVGKVETLETLSLVTTPNRWDHLHAAGADLAVIVVLGAIVVLWRIVAALIGKAVASQRAGSGAMRVYVLDFYEGVFAVGVPIVGIGMSVFEGSKYWLPYLHLWTLLGIAVIAASPVALRLLRFLAEGGARLRTRAPVVTISLLVISVLVVGRSFHRGTQLFGYGYGHIHILATGFLVFVFYLLIGFGFGDGAIKAIKRRYLVMVPSALVLASVGAVTTPPSQATSELLYSTLPTRWVLLSGEFTVDLDGDGFAGSSGVFAGRDCDDYDARRYPDQHEIVGNGFDENCFPGDQEVPIEVRELRRHDDGRRPGRLQFGDVLRVG